TVSVMSAVRRREVNRPSRMTVIWAGFMREGLPARGGSDWPPHRPGREGQGGTGSPSGGGVQAGEVVVQDVALVAVAVVGDRGGGEAGGAGGELVADLLDVVDRHRLVAVTGQQREARRVAAVLVLLGALV